MNFGDVLLFFTDEEMKVGPIYSGRDEDANNLWDCYWNSLEVAKQYKVHSIAFPAISTGVYGYPLPKVCYV